MKVLNYLYLGENCITDFTPIQHLIDKQIELDGISEQDAKFCTENKLGEI